MAELPNDTQALTGEQTQLVQTETKAVKSNDTMLIEDHSKKTRINYFFFLVSFLAVIIFSIAPLLSDGFSELTFFAKAVIPLVLLGALFDYLGTDIELVIKMRLNLRGKSINVEQSHNLYLSDIIFLVILLIELSFVWSYLYL